MHTIMPGFTIYGTIYISDLINLYPTRQDRADSPLLGLMPPELRGTASS